MSIGQPPSAPAPSSLPAETIAYARQFFDHARQGNIGAFRAPLAAGLPPNLRNGTGDTLIMLAAYHGHSELVSFLLENGASPNILNDRQQSPLAGAVFKKEDAVVSVLLTGGADPLVGRPSAEEAMVVFGVQEQWSASFASAPGRGHGLDDL